MDSGLRPMSASQVLDRTFYLYRNNFWLFAGIAMITPALTTMASLLQIKMFGLPVTPDPTKLDPQMMERFFQDMIARAIVGMTLGMAVYAVGYAIASGATVYAVSLLHLGKTTTIQESYARIKAIFWRILALVLKIFFIAAWPLALTYLVFFAAILGMPAMLKGSMAPGSMVLSVVGLLLASLGFVGGIIWFFYAYCRYALAVPACTIENLPVKYALIRSKFLTRGNVPRVLGVYVLTLLIAAAVKGVLQIPAFMATGMFSIKAGMHLSAGWLAWLYGAEFIGTMVAGPIATIAMALLYYDERVRKEAFDLQLMMEAIGQAPRAPIQSTASSRSTLTIG
jgi:hypothetical protein